MRKVLVPPIAALVALALLPAGAAFAQDASTRPALRADEGASPYPAKKRYADFTPAEKAALRGLYEGMAETDEPPYPAAGLRPIMDEVVDIGAQAKAVGLVSIFVKVDATGNATGVRIMKAPDLDVAKAISFVLMKAKYKPATCGGKPCEMEFPFRVILRV